MKKLLILSSLMAIGAVQSSAGSDLIAYWSFDNVGDGIAVDERAGNVGLLLNGAQFTGQGGGRSGSGIDRGMLLGNGQHRMQVIDASFLDAAGSADAISISFWQNLNQVRNQWAFFADSATSPRAFSLSSPWGDSAINWDTGGGMINGEHRLSVLSSATWLSQWVHVVVTKNGDLKRIYVNGVEVAS